MLWVWAEEPYPWRHISCPAKGKQCRYCDAYDHFESVCKKKKLDQSYRRPPRGNYRGQNYRGSGRRSHINYSDTQPDDENTTNDFVFAVDNTDHDHRNASVDVDGNIFFIKYFEIISLQYHINKSQTYFK